MTSNAEWRINRQTHRWVTLNGEDYACDLCDTKTGTEPCPERITTHRVPVNAREEVPTGAEIVEALDLVRRQTQQQVVSWRKVRDGDGTWTVVVVTP